MPDGMFNFAEILTPAGLAVLAASHPDRPHHGRRQCRHHGDLDVGTSGTRAAQGDPAWRRDRRLFLIAFALIATQLLKITGLLLAGGLLLLWVAYNMFRELQPSREVTADDPRRAQSRARRRARLSSGRPCRSPSPICR